jgi:DNA repair protein RadC
VVSAVKPFFRNLDREKFGVLVLNTRNAPVAFHMVSVGNLDSSIVHPREVFKFAILASAASVILVHNHPSGQLDPSSEDINLTHRLVEAGELMGIPVLDHIIITDDAYLSMKSRNLI